MPHCHMNHLLYHTTEDTAILTSPWINIGPSVLMQGLKTIHKAGPSPTLRTQGCNINSQCRPWWWHALALCS